MYSNSFSRSLKIICVFGLFFPQVVFAQSPAVVDPCTVISKVEAEAIMGEKMKAGRVREQKAVGMNLCLYEADSDGSFSMLQVSIIRGEKARQMYSAIKANFPGNEPIAGIGDDAFLATPGLHAIRGDSYLSVAAGNLKRNREKVLMAGKKAMMNLKKFMK